MPRRPTQLFIVALLVGTASPVFANHKYPECRGNSIHKRQFNFAGQLGYLYMHLDDAFFPKKLGWQFQSGLQGFYKHAMPLVSNPKWQQRSLVQIPFALTWLASPYIHVRANVDFVAEFPYRDIHSIGGNAPRFRTKMRLRQQSTWFPALALEVGVKFSSAKPYNMWSGCHNLYDSNGLSGTGTGTADYDLTIRASQSISRTTTAHVRLGLAPVGDPTQTGSQADQILYGLAIHQRLSPIYALRTAIVGMFGALTTTDYTDYAVVRIQWHRYLGTQRMIINAEFGLTPLSDDIVLGLLWRTAFGRSESKRVKKRAIKHAR